MAISLEFLSDLHPDEMEDVLRKMSKEPNDYVPLTINQIGVWVGGGVNLLRDYAIGHVGGMQGAAANDNTVGCANYDSIRHDWS